MKFPGRLAAGLAVGLLSGPALADAPVAKAVLATYADVAQAMYEDALASAEQLDAALAALLADPSDTTLAAAREAWLAARSPYQQTEGYRFGNAIVDDWEGKVNAWPLDEGLIDYVDHGSYGDSSDENPLYTANVIGSTSLRVGNDTIDTASITPALLSDNLQEAQGVEANVATGYHAIEFLLWGQDRPGDWAVILGCAAGETRQLIRSPSGRHFYGHGAYSPDGRLLYATENRIATGEGVLGIYDASVGYPRIGELPTHGIGPHDLAWLPGTERLAVANGGIRTAPDSGRETLNPATMEPSLVLLRPETSELLWKIDLGLDRRMLSIRHLAVARDGSIAFGCQSQGDPFELPPLVGIASPAGAVRFVEQPDETLAALANYVGSVALDGSGRVLAATSPHGGTVGFWDLASGRWLGSHAMPDVCGVAPAERDGLFLLTSGNSGVELCIAAEPSGRPVGGRLDGWSWDNHLLQL